LGCSRTIVPLVTPAQCLTLKNERVEAWFDPVIAAALILETCWIVGFAMTLRDDRGKRMRG
jgi:hypothetical protein